MLMPLRQSRLAVVLPERACPVLAVLLILAACDTIVPFKKGWELRRGMGKPETVVVLSGHYTALLYLLYIRSTAFEFFQSHFETH